MPMTRGAFSRRRSGHAEASKSSGNICAGCLLAHDGGRARCEGSIYTTRCHQGWRRRKAFPVGLWSLSCKRRVGMDAGRKRRTQYRILFYLLAHKAWKRMVPLGCGCSRIRHTTIPEVGRTLPKLIVYHLDKTLTDQLAEIGLNPRDVAHVAISHTHGDHIGNMACSPTHNPDTASRVQLDKFAQRTQRQRKSIDGARA